MSEYFISRNDAEADLLAAATYIAERITSMDGHAEAMLSVVPQYLRHGNVDLAAELSNTVDDPFTRDRLLIATAEKCAELDDNEYARQLADAVEDPGLQAQAHERIGRQMASKGNFEGARELAGVMSHPDGVLASIAIRQDSDGNGEEALATIEGIEYAGAAVTAYHELAVQRFQAGDKDRAVEMLDRAVEEASEIEHREEQARAYCDLGSAYIDAGRNDLAIQTFDKAKSAAELIDNMHRDGLLSLTSQGFMRAGSIELADRALDLVADKTQTASCLLGYSREYWRKDERDEAIETLEEANAILESQHERETRSRREQLRLFASIAAQFAGFERGERAIAVAESIKDDAERTAALTQVAAILAARNENEQARHAYRAIAEDGDRVFALISMSDAKEKNGDRDAAKTLLGEASELVETVPQLVSRAAAYTEIARRAGHFGDEALLERSLGEAFEVIATLKDESAKVSALTSISALAYELGLEFPESERGKLTAILGTGV